MSVILAPEQGDDIQVNGWNWRPTLSLLRANGLLDEETFQRMGAPGCGGAADEALAERMAAVVDAKLSGMKPGERMLSDLSLTAQAKSGDICANDIYSASYEWLVTFRDSCRCSKGFKVV